MIILVYNFLLLTKLQLIQLILWVLIPKDYLQKNSSQSIVNLIINNLKNIYIILLYDKSFPTLKDTEIIIKSFKTRGYLFPIIDEI